MSRPFHFTGLLASFYFWAFIWCFLIENDPRSESPLKVPVVYIFRTLRLVVICTWPLRPSFSISGSVHGNLNFPTGGIFMPDIMP